MVVISEALGTCE